MFLSVSVYNIKIIEYLSIPIFIQLSTLKFPLQLVNTSFPPSLSRTKNQVAEQKPNDLSKVMPGIFTEVRSKAGSRVLLRGSVEKVVLAEFSSVHGLRQRRLSSERPGTDKK